MKNQAFFSSKDKSKKLKCRQLHFCMALYGLILTVLMTVSFSVLRNVQ